jgi:hypothetical protein
VLAGTQKIAADSNPRVEENDMNLVVWLIVGGVIGWRASLIMNSPENVLLNVVVGIVGP